MGSVRLENVTIGYGAGHVIEDFNLTVNDGEMMSLLGPSGTGKTTILKAVAGLMPVEAGEIYINDQPVGKIPAQKRDTVMVFQKPLLFPFMNVAQNIGFGLKMTGLHRSEIKQKTDHILKLVELDDMGPCKVHELSGGQQQRVSLARALVLNPAVLLLDEPLSSLDANLRQQMRELIIDIQGKTGITTLFVTHDQAEALIISHRVGLVLDGRLRQAGTPRELFHQPADPETARFFGGRNFFAGNIQNGRFQSDIIDVPVNTIGNNGYRYAATIRPEDIRISAENDYPHRGKVQKIHFEGMMTRVRVTINNTVLEILTPQGSFKKGQTVWLDFPPDALWIFPGEDEHVVN